MKYMAQGKRSRAWWLQAIKWFGDTGRNGIMREAKIGANYVTDAITELKVEGYVEQIGLSGPGNHPKYNLTEHGEQYLKNNQHELADKPDDTPLAPKPKPVFTWKHVMGGGVRYFMDGKMVPTNDVPDDELHRMQAEIKEGAAGSPEPEKPAQDEHSGADVYTWQQPVAGPVRYFRNGEFILQTEIPAAELERMEVEQQPASATPPVYHAVPKSPVFAGPPLPKAIAKEPLSEQHDDVAVAMTEDAAVDGLMAAREAFNYKPDPSARINKEQGSEKLESDKNDNEAKARTDKGIAIAQHVVNNGGVPVDDEQHLPATEPVTPPKIILRHGKSQPRASLNTPEIDNNAAHAARGMFDQPGVAKLMRETINEILFEKYAHTLTATEVLERLESKV